MMNLTLGSLVTPALTNSSPSIVESFVEEGCCLLNSLSFLVLSLLI